MCVVKSVRGALPRYWVGYVVKFSIMSGTESQHIESHFTQLRGEEHLHDDQLNVDEQCCQDRNMYSSSCGHGVTRSYVSVIYAPRERRLGLPTRLGL